MITEREQPRKTGFKIGEVTFDSVRDFRYLGIILMGNNDIRIEMKHNL